MFSGKMKKENGKLVFSYAINKNTYATFINSLNEGDEVEMFIEELSDDASLGQLAKVHILIREIASHTGNTVTGIKLLIKDKIGLCFQRNGELVVRSFGDCSKQELELAINECIVFGSSLGIVLNR